MNYQIVININYRAVVLAALLASAWLGHVEDQGWTGAPAQVAIISLVTLVARGEPPTGIKPPKKR